ncbi:MAG: hypothetical protein QOG43_1629 [Actinomycetota bacterium]|jgi:hypothetical protein|nr:hypothetical protein [Actinomycetota bacterium]
MADATLVSLLLVFIWAAVLIPPAAGARAAREAEFLGSIRPDGYPLVGTLGRGQADFDAVDQPRLRPALTANARRRQVLGGLVVAMGATLLVGLLPAFHLLLIVHLFLVNSCLAYVGLLVHMRDQATGRTATASTTPIRTLAIAAEPAFAYADDAYEGGYADDLGYYPVDDEEEAAFADADAYGYAEEADEEYGGYGYAADGYADYDDAEDEAEAAYVDELGLALPA